MRNGDNHDFEKRLKTVKLRPAPAGLRKRVLGAARQTREATAWTTPLLRKCLAGCAVSLAFALISDAILSRTQQNRLQALLDGSSRTESRADAEGQLFTEVLGDSISSKILAQEKALLAHQMSFHQARLGYLRTELLREDFEDNESP